MAAAKKVLVFGVFDLLHPGHINFLRQAAKLGDKLYVILAHDISVFQRKGRQTKHNLKTRRQNLAKLPFIHKIITGQSQSSRHHLSVLKINPDVIALGYDQGELIKKLGKTINKLKKVPVIIKLKPYYPDKYKTSKFIKTNKQ